MFGDSGSPELSRTDPYVQSRLSESAAKPQLPPIEAALKKTLVDQKMLRSSPRKQSGLGMPPPAIAAEAVAEATHNAVEAAGSDAQGSASLQNEAAASEAGSTIGAAASVGAASGNSPVPPIGKAMLRTVSIRNAARGYDARGGPSGGGLPPTSEGGSRGLAKSASVRPEATGASGGRALSKALSERVSAMQRSQASRGLRCISISRHGPS